MSENAIVTEILVSHVATGDMSKEIGSGDYLKDDYVGLIEFQNKVVLINRVGNYITPCINDVKNREIFFPIPVYKKSPEGFSPTRKNGDFMCPIAMLNKYTNHELKLSLEYFIGSQLYDNEWVNQNVKKLIAYLTNNQQFLKVI